MIAYPIPRGATVIATPAMRGMPISPPLPMNSSLQHSPGANPEARYVQDNLEIVFLLKLNIFMIDLK